MIRGSARAGVRVSARVRVMLRATENIAVRATGKGARGKGRGCGVFAQG